MYAFVYDLAQPLNANHRNIFDIQRALPVGSKHLFEVNWTQKSRLLTTEFSFGSFKKIYGGYIENFFTIPAENKGQFGLKLAFCLCQKKEKIPSQRLHHIKVVSRWLFFCIQPSHELFTPYIQRLIFTLMSAIALIILLN